MKRFFATPLILLAALLANACHNPVNPEEGEISASLYITVDVTCEAGSTRGFIDADETALSNLNIFIYDEASGLIHSTGYFTSYHALHFDNLIEGRRYRILALANNGRRNAPAHLAQALQTRVYMDDPGSIAEEGIPMACDTVITFGSAGDGYSLCLGLKRLMARYSLRLDLSQMRGELELRSAEVFNVSGSVTPWQEESRAMIDEMCDGDALTDEELEGLVDNETVRLLVPENMQGDLLEENDDPWQKNPSEIGEEGDCCTYLEILARYRFEGITINDLRYRIYLGEDNIRNFDIRRNTSYVLTLSLTDTNAVVASSWKVTRGDVEDSRVLVFDRNRDTLLQHASLVRNLLRQPTPFGYRFVAGEGFAEAGLSFTDDGTGGCRVSSGAIDGHSRTGRLWAVSWDGAKRDYCDITIMNWDTLLTVHSTRPVMWAGDTARLTATMFFENDGSTRDVTRYAQWSVSGSSAAWLAGSAVGQDIIKVYGGSVGAVSVTANYLRRNCSLREVVSTHVSVGHSGPDTLYVHVGDTIHMDCFTVFASGDTLHDNNEFLWRSVGTGSEIPFLTLSDGRFIPTGTGNGGIEFTLKRDLTKKTRQNLIVLP
ncbi:MAG: DUF4906 domain-containing protein [Bacteroidales bacterium]|nr:DUF4906 domain-containing protein [Bacteroidales bacterium]